MKNKFEALNAFQSWPEDWQRLCAEYWAENDKPSGSVTTSLHPMWEELHQRASKVAEECYPQAVAKVVENVKPRKRKKVSSARRWHAQELEWLVFCTDQAKPKAQGIRDFLRRYTDREFEACVQQLRLLKNKKKTVYK
jgi:hypothetical protein